MYASREEMIVSHETLTLAPVCAISRGRFH